MSAKDNHSDKEVKVLDAFSSEELGLMQKAYELVFDDVPDEKLSAEYKKLLWEFSTEEGRLDYRNWMVKTMGWCAPQEEIDKVQSMKLVAAETVFKKRGLVIPESA